MRYLSVPRKDGVTYALDKMRFRQSDITYCRESIAGLRYRGVIASIGTGELDMGEMHSNFRMAYDKFDGPVSA